MFNSETLPFVTQLAGFRKKGSFLAAGYDIISWEKSASLHGPKCCFRNNFRLNKFYGLSAFSKKSRRNSDLRSPQGIYLVGQQTGFYPDSCVLGSLDSVLLISIRQKKFQKFSGKGGGAAGLVQKLFYTSSPFAHQVFALM